MPFHPKSESLPSMTLSRRQILAQTSAVAAVGAGTFLSAGPAAAIQRTDGLILGAGPSGRFDDAKVGGPCVVWREDEQMYWMYYYGRSKTFPKKVAPAFGTGSIGIAKSKDGKTWERFDGPLEGGAVFTPNTQDANAFDTQHLGLGNVFYHSGMWYMSYFGGDATLPTEIDGAAVHPGYQFKGYRCRTGVARSTDGINWTRVDGGAYGGAATEGMDTIYSAFPTMFHDGDKFVLIYTALTSKMFYWETRVSTSTDLTSWEDQGPMTWTAEPKNWEQMGMVTRQVMKNPMRQGGKWLMIYAALDGNFTPSKRRIAMATSDDGVLWSHLYEDPVFIPGSLNSWDGEGVAYPNLVKVGKKYHLYYYGFANKLYPFDENRGIGLAISGKRDFPNFRRF